MAQRVKNKPELKIVVSNTPEVPAVEPVPEQVEMPFAIVNGEPVTQMPKDLYIPPQAMEVFLEAFEGPLDLLLYLIRRQNLNILDIPLAEITRQYMQYIEVMTELQLELAGEYMVMAATLAEIKSRMLLPRPKVDPEGKEDDPRAELVRRLQEYERFKRAAEDIDSLHRLERDVWTTSADLKDRSVVKLLPTVTLQEMLLAFKDVVVRSEMFAHHHISRERLSVRERMSDVLARLEQASFVEFIRLFRLDEGRMGVTVTFMALLELVREGLIEIVQAVPFAPLHVRAAGASRKLHVVGGNETLADGTVVDDTTAVVVGQAVVGEAVVGDVPPVGLLLPGDAGLDTIVEQVLDPNFVDEDFDAEDELLEGVDDLVDRIAAPATPAAPEPEVGSPEAEVGLADAEVGLADTGLADAGAGVAGAIGAPDVLAAPDREVGLADAGAGAYLNVSLVELPSVGSTVEPVSVVDDWAPDIDSPAMAHVPTGEGAAPASLTGEAGDFHETAALSEAGEVVDLTSASVANELSVSTDVVAVAVESVLVAAPAEISRATASIEPDPVFAQRTSAYEVVAAEFAETPSEPSNTVVGSATELDEAGALVESVSDFAHVAEAFEPATVELTPTVGEISGAFGEAAASPLLHEPTASVEPTAALSETSAVVGLAPMGDLSPLADLSPFADLATEDDLSPYSAVAAVSTPTDSIVEDVPAPENVVPENGSSSLTGDLASPSDPAVTAGSPLDDIAVTFDPSVTTPVAAADEPLLTDVSAAASEPPAFGESPPAPVGEPSAEVGEPSLEVGEPSAGNEVGVTVDPAVFDAPIATAESDPPADTQLDEPPAVNVEYESPEEAVAAGEQPAVDEDVSLIGDTPVVGEASLVGDESVSGGPAVEVEEFAFDELPALDDAEPADQQPAAGAEAVVNKVPGTDEPSSSGEESDD